MAKYINLDLPEEKTTDVRDIIGKKVLAENGEEVGTVDTLHINEDTMAVEAIKVSRGMFSYDHYIGMGYVESISEDGAVLNIVPANQLIGKDVHDSGGKKIGEVKDVKRIKPTNELFSIVVDLGFRKGELVIKEDEIKTIGENIILNKEH